MGRGGEGGGRNNKKFWGAGIRMLEILFARRGRRETRPKFVARLGTFRAFDESFKLQHSANSVVFLL